eukprot:13117025-Alexandrium_andersonii.AAC.1
MSAPLAPLVCPRATGLSSVQPSFPRSETASGCADKAPTKISSGPPPVSYTHLTLPTICSV